MIDWKKVGEDFGRMFGEGLAKGISVASPALADALRAHYRETYGACSRCDAPLAGPSPSQLCTDCHAAIVLEQARGEEPAVEA